jgi:hypothetical protein
MRQVRRLLGGVTGEPFHYALPRRPVMTVLWRLHQTPLTLRFKIAGTHRCANSGFTPSCRTRIAGLCGDAHALAVGAVGRSCWNPPQNRPNPAAGWLGR